MSRLLQNHPGEHKFPVNMKTRLPHGVESRQTISGALRALIFVLIMFGLLGMAILFFDTPADKKEEIRPVLLSVSGIVAACILVYHLLWRVDAGAAKQEQLRYYRTTKTTPLSNEKLEALQLDAHRAYAYQFWSETLAELPCEVELPDPHKQKTKFPLMGIYPKDELIKSLDEDWGIITRAGYENMRDRLFKGLHSRPFAEEMTAMGPNEEENRKAMIERLSGLLQEKDSTFVEASVISQGGNPPSLLWGFDLWRVIPMARAAYGSGFISADEAWDDILKASQWAHAIFPDLESFLKNLRLGHAYWCNSFEKCAERREQIDNFLSGTPQLWPIRKHAWKQTTVQDLPADVIDGFKDSIAAERAEEDDDPRPIGFHPNA